MSQNENDGWETVGSIDSDGWETVGEVKKKKKLYKEIIQLFQSSLGSVSRMLGQLCRRLNLKKI